MMDTTTTVEGLYLGLRKVFDNLNRLGKDFGEGLRAQGLDFTEVDEYSRSPASFEVKDSHAWMFYRAFDEEDGRSSQTLVFGAAYVYFEANKAHKRWKLSGPGRPELWFFLGTATPPPTEKLASTIKSFFDNADIQCFKPKPKLDGRPVRYEYRGESSWDAVVLGVELGAIQALSDLQSKAIGPLVDAAKEAKLSLWD